jgi:predicted tellurium resistance membrane protein TerC
MNPPLWLWIGFNTFALVMLALGLGVVLTFVGVKMLLAHTAWKIDTHASLAVIVLVLAGAVVLSLLRPKRPVAPKAPSKSVGSA